MKSMKLVGDTEEPTPLQQLTAFLEVDLLGFYTSTCGDIEDCITELQDALGAPYPGAGANQPPPTFDEKAAHEALAKLSLLLGHSVGSFRNKFIALTTMFDRALPFARQQSLTKA